MNITQTILVGIAVAISTGIIIFLSGSKHVDKDDNLSRSWQKMKQEAKKWRM